MLSESVLFLASSIHLFNSIFVPELHVAGKSPQGEQFSTEGHSTMG